MGKKLMLFVAVVMLALLCMGVTPAPGGALPLAETGSTPQPEQPSPPPEKATRQQKPFNPYDMEALQRFDKGSHRQAKTPQTQDKEKK